MDEHTAHTAQRDPNSLLAMYVRVFGWLSVALGLCRMQASIRAPCTFNFAAAAASMLLEFVWFTVEGVSGTYNFQRPCGTGVLEPCPRRVVGAILTITSVLALWCIAAAWALHKAAPRKDHVD